MTFSSWFNNIGWINLRRIGLMIVTCMALFWGIHILHKIINKITRFIFGGNNLEAIRRINTLAIVLENVARVLAVSFLFTAILQELNIELKAIFVSFGILGTILGLGSQNIVKDVINGVLLLVENQFGVGDVISVGDKHAGVVESMTLRITVIRDMEGRAHYIANSSICDVVVMSKEFARAMVDVEISQNEDISKVISVLQDIGIELASGLDAVYEPTEVLGVENMTSVSCIIRTLTKTKPGQQWFVARELRKRIIIRFQKEGFARPQQLAWYRSWTDSLKN